MHGVPMSRGAELAGTAAGKGLKRMKAHVESVRAKRARHEAYESPEAVAERRRAKRQEKARARDLRQYQTQRKNAERLALLADLARLSVAERFSRFAMDPTLNLGSAPVFSA